MTSSKRPPPLRKSGEHPAVIEYRKKLDSIADKELSELRELNERLAKRTPLPKRDPRREEEDDPRKEDEIPEDVVELPELPKLRLRSKPLDVEEDPFPSRPPAPEKKP